MKTNMMKAKTTVNTAQFAAWLASMSETKRNDVLDILETVRTEIREDYEAAVDAYERNEITESEFSALLAKHKRILKAMIGLPSRLAA